MLLPRNRYNHKLRLRLFADGLAVGVLASLVISFFRYGLELVEQWRSSFYSQVNTASPQFWGWLVGLVIIAVILHKLTQVEPLASGSGIPQVKGALLNLINMNWLRVIWVKIVGGIMGIGAGLSLGREGPSIQLGAMTAQGYTQLIKRSPVEMRYLISSGAAAGLAAAFNAPLAGVIFALEELHHNFSMPVLMPSMAGAFAATFVSRLIFGGSSVFIFPEFHALQLSQCGLVIGTALIAGLAGIIFNKGLLNIGRFYRLPIFKNTLCKLIFALGISVILGLTIPQVLGGGSQLINYLAHTPVSLELLILFLVAKFLFTLISYGIGIPGGFFLPMLVIGALTGGVCAKLLLTAGLITSANVANILVIAMVAFFAASVRAPITGTILIMEMSKSYSILLSCGMAAMIGFVLAELLHSKPIYEALLEQTLHQQKYKQLLQEEDLSHRTHDLQEEDQYYNEE